MNLTLLLLTRDDAAQVNNGGIQKCPWTSCFAKSSLVVAISSRSCASDPSTGLRKALCRIDFPFLVAAAKQAFSQHSRFIAFYHTGSCEDTCSRTRKMLLMLRQVSSPLGNNGSSVQTVHSER